MRGPARARQILRHDEATPGTRRGPPRNRGYRVNTDTPYRQGPVVQFTIRAETV